MSEKNETIMNVYVVNSIVQFTFYRCAITPFLLKSVNFELRLALNFHKFLALLKI